MKKLIKWMLAAAALLLTLLVFGHMALRSGTIKSDAFAEVLEAVEPKVNRYSLGAGTFSAVSIYDRFYRGDNSFIVYLRDEGTRMVFSIDFNMDTGEFLINRNGSFPSISEYVLRYEEWTVDYFDARSIAISEAERQFVEEEYSWRLISCSMPNLHNEQAWKITLGCEVNQIVYTLSVDAITGTIIESIGSYSTW